MNQKFFTSTFLLLVLIVFSFKGMAQQYGENYVIFEAEQTSSPLKNWKLITADNPKYFDPYGGISPINGAYLEYNGGNRYNVSDADSPLEYTFICPKTATYRLVMRLHQRLEGEAGDKCNDVYIKMAGDFTKHASLPYTQSDMESYMKFYGGGITTWGVCMNGEGGADHVHSAMLYNFTEGEEYTLTMAGRSDRTGIDYILFYESTIDMHIERGDDLAANNPHQYRPRYFTCNTIKAVDFHTYTGINGFADADVDNKEGLPVLSIGERDAWAAARFYFEGGDGDAYFNLDAMQEEDGESTYIVKINGVEIGRGTNDYIYGTSTPNYTIQNHEINDSLGHVSLNNGDTIQVEFNNTTNGKVPEDGLTATARGRWVSLDFCTSGWMADYSVNILEDNLSLLIGESDTLSVIVDLGVEKDTAVIWSSGDTSLVDVDTNGVVTSKKNGTTYVYATTVKFGKADSCRVYSLGLSTGNLALNKPVTASSSDSHTPDLLVDGNIEEEARWSASGYPQWAEVDLGAVYYINKTELICAWDRKYQYTILVKEDETSPYIQIIDRSDNTTAGKVTAPITDEIDFNVRGRFVKIVVTGEGGSYAGSWISLVELRVFGEVDKDASKPDYIPVTGIEIDNLNEELAEEETLSLSASIAPANASNQKISWISANTTIATVNQSSGEVVAKATGTTWIYVETSEGGFTDSCQVTVVAKETSISEVEQAEWGEVYPNPFTTSFSINLFDNTYTQAVLMDLTGKVISSKEIHNNEVTFSPAYSEAVAGIYLVRLQGENKVQIIKLLRSL